MPKLLATMEPPHSFCTYVQAVAAAVQTTHLLRLLTAIALIMVLRSAKSAMYSGKEISTWQQALLHVYDLPPLVLLTVLQLSAIALPAKLYHDSPRTVPHKVHHIPVAASLEPVTLAELSTQHSKQCAM